MAPPIPLPKLLLLLLVVVEVEVAVARGWTLDTPPSNDDDDDDEEDEDEEDDDEDVGGIEDGGGTKGVPPKAKWGSDSDTRGLACGGTGRGTGNDTDFWVEESGCDGSGNVDVVDNVIEPLSLCWSEPLSLCCVVWREEDRAPSVIRIGAGARPDGASPGPGPGAIDDDDAIEDDDDDDDDGRLVDRRAPTPPIPILAVLVVARGGSIDTVPGTTVSLVLSLALITLPPGNNEGVVDDDDDGSGDGSEVCWKGV